MMRFYYPARRLLITTSFKVMYSSLRKQPQFRQIPERQFIGRLLLARLRLRRAEHLMLVRDPYARLASCFRDKYRQIPPVIAADPEHPWQDCHRLLWPYLGITADSDPQDIAGRFLSMSFEDFLRLLPKLHLDDAHFAPQVLGLTSKIYARWLYLPLPFKVPIDLPVDRIVRIEDAEQVRGVGIDLNIRENQTVGDEESVDDPYTPETIAIVNRLYRDDFERFGYPMRDVHEDSTPAPA